MPIPRRCAVALGLAALLASPVGALADVQVSQSLSRVTITAVPTTNSAPNRILVRPHIFTGNGVEVRQLGFGDPPIRDASHDVCSTDGVANAVVCNSPTTTFDVTLGSQSETLEFGSAETHPIGCTPTDDGVASENVQVNGDLGGGDDSLFVVSTGPCAPGTIPDTGIGDYLPRFTLNGGAGNDSLHGAGRDDVLAGGPGNDAIDGGAGNDQISDAAGTNTLRGGPGDDFFTGLAGRNAILGNAGTDTVSYGGQSAGRVGVTIGDASNEDGIAGVNQDDVQDTVENVVGGGQPDALVGSAADNSLTGGEGGDFLDGAGGNDRLHGGNGNDTLKGGPGIDSFDPGAGDDVVDSRDGLPETIDCGPGTGDFATVDLVDRVATISITGTNLRLPTCESVSRFAADDGPPARIAAGTVRVAAGAVTVRLTCPRAAKVDCRGRITLSRATRSGGAVARAAYVIPRGGSAPVALAVTAAQARSLRGARRALLVTSEHGASRKGPRSARRLVTIR